MQWHVGKTIQGALEHAGRGALGSPALHAGKVAQAGLGDAERVAWPSKGAGGAHHPPRRPLTKSSSLGRWGAEAWGPGRSVA